MKQFSATEIDEKFDNGEDVDEYFDMEHPVIMPGMRTEDTSMRKVTSTVPQWVLDSAERRANRIGTTRAAVINTWLAEMADKSNEQLKAVS